MQIIPFRDWAREPLKPIPLLARPVPWLVIHHAPERATQVSSTRTYEESQLRIIHNYHLNPNPAKITAGIGYNHVVAPSGRVYEGRGLGLRGAHSGEANGRSIGVLCLWDGSKPFPAPGVASLKELADHLVTRSALAVNWRARFHREFRNTACPGNALVAQLTDLEKAPKPVVEPPLVGTRVWSNFFREWLIVTEYNSDADWKFVRESRLQGTGTKADSRFSSMPEDRGLVG